MSAAIIALSHSLISLRLRKYRAIAVARLARPHEAASG